MAFSAISIFVCPWTQQHLAFLQHLAQMHILILDHGLHGGISFHPYRPLELQQSARLNPCHGRNEHTLGCDLEIVAL
jgi:hypothetical protein